MSKKLTANKRGKIIFFGTSEFSVPILGKLLESGFNVPLVITSPAKPAGRKQDLTASPVKIFINTSKHKSRVSCHEPDKLDESLLAKIKRIKPDLFVVASYGKILPVNFLSIPRLGSLNIHPSLLPKYRGASPIQAAILNDEIYIGVTIILMDEKVDHGPMLAQIKGKIPDRNSIRFPELRDFLAEKSADLLLKIIPEWLKGNINPLQQSEAKATFTKILKKIDGRINWSNEAAYIERMIRAYDPWPGAFTELKGNVDLRIKILDAMVIAIEKKYSPGEFFETANSPAVMCGGGALKLIRVQQSGGKPVSGEEFLRGHRYPPGTLFG